MLKQIRDKKKAINLIVFALFASFSSNLQGFSNKMCFFEFFAPQSGNEYKYMAVWYRFAMRTVILYYSKTGNTEKYARAIGDAVKCDVLPLNKFKKKMIGDYDTIVFGSRVIGSKIQKVDDFLAMYDLMKEKNVIIFAVGMSIPSKEGRAALISANILDLYHIRFYQLRGSFDYAKLNPLEKLLMSNSLRMISNDPNSTADQKMLLSIKDNPIECYDDAGVDRIISVIRKIDSVVVEPVNEQ